VNKLTKISVSFVPLRRRNNELWIVQRLYMYSVYWCCPGNHL